MKSRLSPHHQRLAVKWAARLTREREERDAALTKKVRAEIAFRRGFEAANPTVAGLLAWEVLPAGQWKSHSKDWGRRNQPSSEQGRFEPQRFELLESLEPKLWYSGSHLGLTVYLVAVFDKLAIADSPDWGNALYYCPADRWQSVFRMEKRVALAAGARRIIHTQGWEARVQRLVRAR